MRIVAVGRMAIRRIGYKRAGHTAAIHLSVTESRKASKVKLLAHLRHALSNARNKAVTLPTPDEFAAAYRSSAGGYVNQVRYST
jgi:hypothetical protein